MSLEVKNKNLEDKNNNVEKEISILKEANAKSQTEISSL